MLFRFGLNHQSKLNWKNTFLNKEMKKNLLFARCYYQKRKENYNLLWLEIATSLISIYWYKDNYFSSNSNLYIAKAYHLDPTFTSHKGKRVTTPTERDGVKLYEERNYFILTNNQILKSIFLKLDSFTSIFKAKSTIFDTSFAMNLKPLSRLRFPASGMRKLKIWNITWHSSLNFRQFGWSTPALKEIHLDLVILLLHVSWSIKNWNINFRWIILSAQSMFMTALSVTVLQPENGKLFKITDSPPIKQV